MSCKMGVVITNGKGEQVMSKLFQSLVSAARNGSTAKRLYNLVTSDDFKNLDLYKNLVFDENGEPTIESLMDNGLKKYIDTDKLNRAYTIQLGGIEGTNVVYRDSGVNSGTKDFFGKANEFNNGPHGKNNLAVVFYDEKIRRHYLKVIAKTQNNTQAKERISSVNKAMIEISNIIDKEGFNFYNINTVFEYLSRNFNFLNIDEKNQNYEKLDGKSIVKLFKAFVEYVSYGSTDTSVLGVTNNEFGSKIAKAIFDANDIINSQNYKRLINALMHEESSSLFRAGNILSEEELNVNNKIRAVAIKLIYNRMNGIKSKVEAVDNIVSLLINDIKGTRNGGLMHISYTDEYQNLDNISIDINNFDIVSKKRVESTDEYKAGAEHISKLIQNAERELSKNDKEEAKFDEVYEKILKLENRRLQMSKQQKMDTKSRKLLLKEQMSIIEMLVEAKDTNTESLAILKYIDYVNKKTNEMYEKINLVNSDSVDFQEKARILNSVKEFVDSVNSIKNDLRHTINRSGQNMQSLYDEVAKSVKSDIRSLYVPYKKGNNINISDIKANPNIFFEDIPNKKEELINACNYVITNSKSETQIERAERLKYNIELISVLSSDSSFTDKSKYLSRVLNAMSEKLQDIEIIYDESAADLYCSYLDMFQDEEAREVKFGEYQGIKAKEKVDLLKLAKKITKDANMAQRFLSSAKDAPDMILNLHAKAIKASQHEARMLTKKDMDEIKREAMIYEKATGNSDFSWLYEKDENGKKTGYYVSSYEDNILDVLLKDKKIREALDLVQGEGFNWLNINDEQREFLLKEIDKKKQSNDYKDSKQYKDIMSNPAKKRFYEFFMSKYNKLQSLYPSNSIQHNRIIGIRKDRLEVLKSSNNKLKETWELIKDDYRATSDDDMSGVQLGLDGEIVKRLPVYYCNFTDDEADMMSDDAVSCLLAFSDRARNYQAFTKSIDILETGREVFKRRQIEIRNGEKVLKETLRRFKEKVSKDDRETVTEESGTTSNLYKMLDDLMEVQVYGRVRDRSDNDTVLGLNIGKTVNAINKRCAESALSFSVANGISNVMTGIVQMNIESFCNQYWSPKDNAVADAIYMKEIVPYMAQLGDRAKTNKLALFSEMFDIQDEFDNEMRDFGWIKNNKVKQFITNGKTTQVLQNAGEHWMSHRTALALANKEKFKDKDGKEYSLWEALEEKYYDENGNLQDKDMGLGAELVFKKGLTSKDGLDMDNEENVHKFIFDFHSRVMGINQTMHGIYNSKDANAIQRYAIGRLAYMFRKWIPKSINRRFGEIKYDYDIKQWTEGYYRTSFRFLKNLFKDIKEQKKLFSTIQANWKNLDEIERRNVIRAILEESFFALSCLSVKLMEMYKESGKDGDDDDESWWMSQLRYQLYRLRSEVGALTISVDMPEEALRILKSPAAAINTFDALLDTWKMLDISEWGIFAETEEEYQTYIIKRGMWKDHSRGFKNTFGNKFVFPKLNVFYKNANIAESIGFYTKGM